MKLTFRRYFLSVNLDGWASNLLENLGCSIGSSTQVSVSPSPSHNLRLPKHNNVIFTTKSVLRLSTYHSTRGQFHQQTTEKWRQQLTEWKENGKTRVSQTFKGSVRRYKNFRRPKPENKVTKQI